MTTEDLEMMILSTPLLNRHLNNDATEEMEIVEIEQRRTYIQEREIGVTLIESKPDWKRRTFIHKKIRFDDTTFVEERLYGGILCLQKQKLPSS